MYNIFVSVPGIQECQNKEGGGQKYIYTNDGYKENIVCFFSHKCPKTKNVAGHLWTDVCTTVSFHFWESLVSFASTLWYYWCKIACFSCFLVLSMNRWVDETSQILTTGKSKELTKVEKKFPEPFNQFLKSVWPFIEIGNELKTRKMKANGIPSAWAFGCSQCKILIWKQKSKWKEFTSRLSWKRGHALKLNRLIKIRRRLKQYLNAAQLPAP